MGIISTRENICLEKTSLPIPFQHYTYQIFKLSHLQLYSLREAAKKWPGPATKALPLELSGHIFVGFFLELQKVISSFLAVP